MDTKYKTLSTQSAEVIRHFTDINSIAFTFSQVRNLLKRSSTEAVKKLMRDMVKRGLLLRLKNGVYHIIPYEEKAVNYFPSSHLIAKNLVNDARYYIGYYSALELHSLITQPSMREQVVVNKQVKPSSLNIEGHKFQFIYHNKNHFFGSRDLWVDGFNKVPASDLEKTFIDCLYKPDYAGGITEIAKALFKSREKLAFEKLLEYCKKFNAQSVIKRLGFLLEVLKINNPIMKELENMKTASIILLEPSYEKKGKLISKWSIQQNIEVDDILLPIFS